MSQNLPARQSRAVDGTLHFSIRKQLRGALHARSYSINASRFWLLVAIQSSAVDLQEAVVARDEQFFGETVRNFRVSPDLLIHAGRRPAKSSPRNSLGI